MLFMASKKRISYLDNYLIDMHNLECPLLDFMIYYRIRIFEHTTKLIHKNVPLMCNIYGHLWSVEYGYIDLRP